MGKLYTHFKELKNHVPEDWFFDKIGLAKFECDNKKYEIFYPRKRANRYTVIHCRGNTVEWEQFSVFSGIFGRSYSKREPIISLGPTKECVRIIVVMGKPKRITGLNEGKFRSADKYDEDYINVMPWQSFKNL